MIINEALSYDDVLLVPGYSDVLPRACDTNTLLCAGIYLKVPVISAAMDTVTEEALAIALALKGGSGVLHRNLSPEEQARQVAGVKQWSAGIDAQSAVDSEGRLIVGAAISPYDYRERIPLLKAAHVDYTVIDAAHGDSKAVCNAIQAIKEQYDIAVIGGNVVTKEGTRRLIDAGADAVKVGLGPGSICTTRIVSGVGIPQFTAVLECAEAAAPIPVIADGGIKYSGDITKAIAAGACVVMIGKLFAGTTEAPGNLVTVHGHQYKEHRGMGSIGALKDGAGDRYQIRKDEKLVPEGVEALVPHCGPLAEYLEQLVSGLRKGMGYCGCKTIQALQQYRRFSKITAQGLYESHTHDLEYIQEAPNYNARNS
ncbi:MAG: IMP dehydrogenase [Treponema sp.]|jgi:IMP dehydrogenase|nr:IMP dehydrogenase [Treponema sp.]